MTSPRPVARNGIISPGETLSDPSHSRYAYDCVAHFRRRRLSDTARALLEEVAAAGDQIAISSITLAEIVYLSEKGRIAPDTLERLISALEQTNALLIEIPFDRQIALALQKVDRTQVPELPDRIIAATARHLDLSIISRDHKIQLSDLQTIW